MIDSEWFETQRPTLFALAYRMLGSAGEAEDVVQDAYLRYTGAPRDTVQSPKAYLSTIVTRLCLDRLKAARTSRERYIGPWLPEPLLTAESDPQQIAEQHESITVAFLVLLETLTPQERAVFLLREVFAYDYDEIAAMLDLSVANCRQIFHRAKEHVIAKRPRFRPSAAQHRQIVERFLAASQRGDIEALTQLLAHDVTLWTDGGGKISAPKKPVHGRDAVAKVLMWFVERVEHTLDATRADLRGEITLVNGEAAVLIRVHGRLDSVLVFVVLDDQITDLRIIRNPEKLGFIQRQLQHNDSGAHV